MALTTYLQIGLLVVIIQVWLLLIFNSDLASRYRRHVTLPTQLEIRDKERVSSRPDARGTPIDNVFNNMRLEDHQERRYDSEHTTRPNHDFSTRPDPQHHQKYQRNLHRQRKQTQMTIEKIGPSSPNPQVRRGRNQDILVHPRKLNTLPNRQFHQVEGLRLNRSLGFPVNFLRFRHAGFNNVLEYERNSVIVRRSHGDVDRNLNKLPLSTPKVPPFLADKSSDFHRQRYPFEMQNFKQYSKSPNIKSVRKDALSPLASKRKFSTKAPHNMNLKRGVFHAQLTPQPSWSGFPNTNREQSPLSERDDTEIFWRPEERSDEVKRRTLEAYLRRKGPDKAVLTPGCPDRGLGSRVTSLAFVKVHKSASTTVANILARYALRHTLNVALPWKKPGAPRFNYFDANITLSHVMPIPGDRPYQVIFNHMIFHRKDLQTFMPNNTFYFAIMREPWDRFLSSFVYYGYAKYFLRRFRFSSVKEAVMFFIRRPQVMKDYTKPELYNSLAGDTGLPPEQQQDVSAIQTHIQKMEQDLNLVMVVEYFEESLVLLKRKACLSMQDIVYLVKNARAPQDRTDAVLTPEEKATFNDFQKADVLMYEHFYQKFWEQVYAEGPEFFLEVRQFRQIQRTMTDFCGQVRSVWDWVRVPRSVWNEEFIVTARECRLMAASELDLQEELIARAVRLYRMSTMPGFLPA